MNLPQDQFLHSVWTDLVGCGPRFMGTEGAAKSVTVITEYLQKLNLGYHLHSFEFESWLPGESPKLQWAGREREAFVMLGSPPQNAPEGPLTGEVQYVGTLGIWDRWDWERFAILSPSGEILAYLAGRKEGPAIPQSLPRGIDSIPYIGIGSEDINELTEAHQTGEVITATLITNPSLGETKVGKNIVVDLPGQGDTCVLISAHYDTFWSTVGAYDNASGSACLMALASQLRDGLPGLNVRLVWFGCEEWLLAGSNAYAHTLQEAGEIPDFVLNLDGVGRGDQLEIWYGPDNLLHSLRSTIEPKAQEFGIDTQYVFPPPEGSDHAAFYRAGSNVCMLTFNDLEILHRPEDTIEEPKFRNMEKTIRIARALIERQAQ